MEICGKHVSKGRGLGLDPEMRGLLKPCRVGDGRSYLWGRHPRSTLLMPRVEGRRGRVMGTIVDRMVWRGEERREGKNCLEGARWSVPRDETFGTGVFTPPDY